MDGVACGKPWGTGAFDSPRSRSAETNNDARRCCRRAVSLPSRTFGEGSLAVIGHRGVECASRRIARSCVDGRRHTLVVVCCFLSQKEVWHQPNKRAARARRDESRARDDRAAGFLLVPRQVHDAVLVQLFKRHSSYLRLRRPTPRRGGVNPEVARPREAPP